MNVALKPMTVERYLDWLEEQPRGRFELVDGQAIAMNAQRLAHIQTKYAIYAAFKALLIDTDCHVVGDGMAVRIDDTTVFEPDALIYRGEPLNADTYIISNPAVVVKILSPGTKTVDTTKKLEGYFKLDSVVHYLILDPMAKTVVHHTRVSGGRISTVVANNGALELHAIGAKLLVADCFEH